jgi:hypothetical protein
MEGAADGDTGKVAKTVLGTIPGQNLWYTAAAWRYFIADNVDYMIDPVKFNKRKAKQLASNEKRIDLLTGGAGGYENFIAKSVKGTRP